MFSFYRLLKFGFMYIVGISLLFGVGAFAVTKLVMDPTYEAAVSIVIEGSRGENSGLRYEDILAAEALAKNMIIIAESNEIARSVSGFMADPELDAKTVRRATKISLIKDSNIMELKVSDSDADRVARLANVYAETFIKRAPEFVINARFKVLDWAAPPEKPAGPSVMINTIAGLMLGFMSSLVGIYVIDFTKRVKSVD